MLVYGWLSIVSVVPVIECLCRFAVYALPLSILSVRHSSKNKVHRLFHDVWFLANGTTCRFDRYGRCVSFDR